MRVIKVCEKCKYFNRCDKLEISFHCTFFDDFSTLEDIYVNRSTQFNYGNCPYHLEHLVMNGAEQNK